MCLTSTNGTLVIVEYYINPDLRNRQCLTADIWWQICYGLKVESIVLINTYITSSIRHEITAIQPTKYFCKFLTLSVNIPWNWTFLRMTWDGPYKPVAVVCSVEARQVNQDDCDHNWQLEIDFHHRWRMFYHQPVVHRHSVWLQQLCSSYWHQRSSVFTQPNKKNILQPLFTLSCISRHPLLPG